MGIFQLESSGMREVLKQLKELPRSSNAKKSLIGLEFLHPKYKIIKQKSELVLPKTKNTVAPFA